jgi:hypothetical protein
LWPQRIVSVEPYQERDGGLVETKRDTRDGQITSAEPTMRDRVCGFITRERDDGCRERRVTKGLWFWKSSTPTMRSRFPSLPRPSLAFRLETCRRFPIRRRSKIPAMRRFRPSPILMWSSPANQIPRTRQCGFVAQSEVRKARRKLIRG